MTQKKVHALPNIEIDQPIQISIILILSLIFLSQVAFIPLTLSIVYLCALLFLFYQYKKQKFNHYKYIQVIFFTIGISIILLQFKTILGVEAGVSFLTLCLFSKSFELKQKRDLLIVFNFALFVSASLFLHSQSFFMAIAVLLCLMSCFIGLYRMQTKLFLKHTQQRIHLKQDLQVIVKLIALATPFFIVLFIFFPRFPPLWSIPIQNEAATTGMSDRMSPGDIAQLSQSSALAFRVLGTLQQLPPRSDMYWRALVLDHYDGRTWTRRIPPKPLNITTSEVIKGVQYQYLNADPTQRWMMSLEHSLPISTDYTMFNDGSITSKKLQPTTQPIHFLWINPAYTAIHLESDLINNQHFPSTFDPKAQQFAQKLWQESQYNPEIYIQNVLNWYKNQQFQYTLSPKRLGTHRVDEFLFDSKQGFCEHYASSFSLLMRYVGIPARVVLGYQGGQFSPDRQSWEVRQLDAHAWSEVWLNQQWVRIDPTATIAPQRIDSGMQTYIDQQRNILGDKQTGLHYYQHHLMYHLHVWQDYASFQWQSKVVGYDVDHQKQFLSQFGLKHLIHYMIALFILIFTLIISYLLWQRYQNQKQYTVYQRYIIQLNRQLPSELQQHLGESFALWITRLKQHYSISATCFDDLIQLYQRVHYAEHIQHGDERQFKKLMKECTNMIKKQKNT